MSVAGHGPQGSTYHLTHPNGSFIESWRAAMDIDWMNRDELAQAIPPAYTAFLAEQIAPALQEAAA